MTYILYKPRFHWLRCKSSHDYKMTYTTYNVNDLFARICEDCVCKCKRILYNDLHKFSFVVHQVTQSFTN
jgi:hypothetical protein